MSDLSTCSDNHGMADKHQEWDRTCRKTATVRAPPLFHYDDGGHVTALTQLT